MKISPSKKEVEEAAVLLVNQYNISTQLLSQLFGVDARDQANTVLRQLGTKTLDRVELAKLLILRRGSMLFGGSQENVKKLRRQLLTSLSEGEITSLFEKLFSVNLYVIKPRKVVALRDGFCLSKSPTIGKLFLYNDGELG